MTYNSKKTKNKNEQKQNKNENKKTNRKHILDGSHGLIRIKYAIYSIPAKNKYGRTQAESHK